MDEETAKRISHGLNQIRIVSNGVWHIIYNWREEVGTSGTLATLEDAIDRFDYHSRKLRRELEALMPPSEPKVAPTVQRHEYREHPRRRRFLCRGAKKNGKPCGNYVEGATAYCRHHQSQAEQGSLTEMSDLVAKLGTLLPGKGGETDA